MRLRSCEPEARRLQRASALHRLSDAGVKRAALDGVERSQSVRVALQALLAQMDERRTNDGDRHAPPLDPA